MKLKKTSSMLTLISTCVVLSGCQHFHTPTKPAPAIKAMQSKPEATTKKTAAVHQQAQNEPLPETQSPVAPAREIRTAWDVILENPGIEVPMNARIKAQKQWYLEHPAFLSQVLSRSEPFIGYVIEEVDKRGLPRALALLPIVESRYDPHAISKAGAVGPWQFMPATAAHFDIKMNWWFDGRRDVITSTHAALTYLEQLNSRFDGDWLLALASYNAGAGNVNKAIRRNQARGRTMDYWSLPVPRETQQYVPRLLALLDIIENAERYHVELPDIPKEPQVTAVNTQSQIDVAQLAQISGLTEEQFRQLNPGLRRWANDPTGPFTVLVPATKAPMFQQKLAQLPAQERMTWHRHTVKAGDTISELAAEYDLPTSELRRINQLSGSFIRVGQSLLVPRGRPMAHNKSNQPTLVKTQNRLIRHKVRPGDTLWDISRQYDSSIRTIAAHNNLSTQKPLQVGTTLEITPAGQSQKVKYQVRPGDSLYRIAKQFKVSIGEIASWNALDQRHLIKPGQSLTLYLSDES